MAGDTVIRSNIGARLSEIAGERQKLQKRLSILAELEKELRALLVEQQDLAGLNPTPEFLNGADRLMALLGRLLSGGGQTLDELANAAKGAHFDFGEKAAKRVLHFKLLAMHRAGLTAKDGDRWMLTDEGRRQLQS